MLIAALLLAAQTTPEPPTPDEIVVIGERMRHVKFSLKTDKKTGVSRCKFKRRSFDPAFDALFCEAARACAPTVSKGPDMEACLKPHVEAYARDLVARRKRAAEP